ncbi:MAG: FKBP-type peptidyl-prolyl cis-trans isomerase [Deltaproteobacteria bacterium]|nr:FKBP-type peptidyl-prolyl cis-trans isomerase [Deltaproteobacteria bacterium]
MIENGCIVTFEYTVFDEQGRVIESSKGEEPVTYVQGQEELIPALEEELSTMEINEERNILLRPEQAYGPFDPNGFTEVPKEAIPTEGLMPGTTLEVRGPGGAEFSCRVHEIRTETVVLDLNHPLAGQTLTFDVKVLGIQPANRARASSS